jgi:transcription-repair coupling factor (superfamily II helicase)
MTNYSQLLDYWADQPMDLPALFVFNSQQDAKRFFSVIRLIRQVEFTEFPARDLLPYDAYAPSPSIIHKRFHLLQSCLTNPAAQTLWTTVSALMERLPPKQYVGQQILNIHVDDYKPMDEFIGQMIKFGYQSVKKLHKPGQIVQRGGVCDLFPTLSKKPYRIEWLDNNICSIHQISPFDLSTIKPQNSITLTPTVEYPTTYDIQHFKERYEAFFQTKTSLSEVKKIQACVNSRLHWLPFYFEQPLCSLLDYLPDNTKLHLMCDLNANLKIQFSDIQKRYNHLNNSLICPPSELYFNQETLNFNEYSCIEHTRQPSNQPSPQITIQHDHSQISKWVLCGGKELKQATIKKFEQLHGPSQIASDINQIINTKQNANQLQSAFDNSWYWPTYKIQFITEHDIMNIDSKSNHGQKKEDKKDEPASTQDRPIEENRLHTFIVGDYVTHVDHGVGTFEGLTTLELNGSEQEMILLKFLDGDKLYVPISDLQKINRYSYDPQAQPKLTKLGGKKWKKNYQQLENDLNDTAVEILKIESQRYAVKRQPIAIDSDIYSDFVISCPFKLTKDQASCMQSIHQDFQANHPMNRLISGDVGFGKTELALRAACIMIASGKQVALLAPTTFLANQHHHTATKRFSKLPISTHLLTRHQTTKQSNQVKSNLHNGSVDLIIGTHAILQSSIQIKQLGLVIIDEEHRFGVKHKNQLKSQYPSVDILSMSATPIPRSLHQALSGIQDMSILSTPPPHRIPVKTIVCPYSKERMLDAIHREIKRDGQVIVIDNHIDRLVQRKKTLQQWLPELKVGHLHGQMTPDEREENTKKFYNRTYQIVVASTLLENGVDQPSVNTLIVIDSDQFGLSTLHQLRGRVGRSNLQAYAYFFHEKSQNLPQKSRNRLSCIQTYHALGAGFHLATYDLDLRGTGELLGIKQSGHTHSVGIPTYNRMLERCIKKIKKQTILHTVKITHYQGARFEDHYIRDPIDRLHYYQQFLQCVDQTTINKLKKELINRFGKPPEQTQRFIDIQSFLICLNKSCIAEIHFRERETEVIFLALDSQQIQAVKTLLFQHQTMLRFKPPNALIIKHEENDFAMRLNQLKTFLYNLDVQQKTPNDLS